MNVLFIGKFPPIQGGTASTSFWRVKALEKFGINFEVITAILDSSEFIIKSDFSCDGIHLIHEKMPWHIPYSQLYAERLISKAIDLSKNKKFDLIEGCYLFPYGFSAFVVSQLLNKPLLLRHAGSDLYRISKDSNIKQLLSLMLMKATTVTNPDGYSTLKSICPDAKIIIADRYVPNDNFFKNFKLKKYTASFLGKVTEKWDRSQLDFFYTELKKRHYNGDIEVYSNNYTIETFNEFFKDSEYKVIPNGFVPPDFVPNILSKTKYLLVSKIPSGIPEESNIYVEGITSGCTPICITKIIPPKRNYYAYLESQVSIYKNITK